MEPRIIHGRIEFRLGSVTYSADFGITEGSRQTEDILHHIGHQAAAGLVAAFQRAMQEPTPLVPPRALRGSSRPDLN